MHDKDFATRILALMPDLIGTIFDAELWPETCDRIAHSLGARAFMIFEFDFENYAAPRFVGSRVAREAGRDFVTGIQSGVDGEEMESYRRFAAFPSGRFFSEFEIYEVPHDRDLPPNPVREGGFSATKAQSRNVAKLNSIGPWVDVASLHLAIPGADAAPELRVAMNALVPLIDRVIEAGRTARALVRQYGLLIETFDLLAFGAAILDGTGRITIKNATFSDMGRDCDSFRTRGDRIEPCHEQDRAPMSQAVAACLDPEAKAASHVFRLARRSGRLPHVVRTMPVRLSSAGHIQQVFCLMVILDPEDDAQLTGQGIAALGLLSQSEKEVCDLIVRGNTLHEIAERRGRSPETVKDQAKAILAKLNCNSRIDLLRIALSTRPPLRQPLDDSKK